MCADADATLAVVLAGGAGIRVDGADKGLLTLHGRPLVEHVLERLRPRSDRLLIVANRHVDEYARHAPTIRDEIPGPAGPLAGLMAAFGFLVANRHALPHWLLTAPVDCPDPPRDLGSRLRAALLARDTARCAYVLRGNKPQPLFALYRVGGHPENWHASAQRALHEHGSPRRWHATFDTLAVAFDDAGDALHNLNTPDAFREYARTHVAT